MTLGAITPTQAATTPVTFGNFGCDFAAAGQGHGSATDPYIINSGLDLQEIADCTNRSTGISNAVVNNDGTVTFTIDTSQIGAFGVNQVVKVENTDSNALDAKYVKVVSSTDTTLTVKLKATAGTTSTGGQITAVHTYFKLGSDINLANGGTTGFNNSTPIAITAASASNQVVTYTAANSLNVGDPVFIGGMGDSAYNLGTVTVQSATANDFTVSSPIQIADGTATSAGGFAYLGGWSPLDLANADFDGAGHTISGLAIHRDSSHQALFGNVTQSVIENLNMTNATVDTTIANPGYASNQYYGILAGEVKDGSIVKNVNISSSKLIVGGRNAGLLAGYFQYSTMQNINVSGNLSFGITSTINPADNWWNFQYMGGVAGYAYKVTGSDITSTATVNATSTSIDSSQNAGVATKTAYYGYAGGIFGRVNSSDLRNLTSSSAVTGQSYLGGAFGSNSCNGEVVNASSTGNVVANATEGANNGINAWVASPVNFLVTQTTRRSPLPEVSL